MGRDASVPALTKDSESSESMARGWLGLFPFGGRQSRREG